MFRCWGPHETTWLRTWKKGEKQQRLVAMREGETEREREKAAKTWIEWAWRPDRLRNCRRFSPLLPWDSAVSLTSMGSRCLPTPWLGAWPGDWLWPWHGSTHTTPRGLRVPLPPPGEPALGEAEGPRSAQDSHAPSAAAGAHSEIRTAGPAPLRCAS